MSPMRHYFTRVHDYMHDPLMPNDRHNPLVWMEALWRCLWNKHLYN